MKECKRCAAMIAGGSQCAKAASDENDKGLCKQHFKAFDTEYHPAPEPMITLGDFNKQIVEEELEENTSVIPEPEAPTKPTPKPIALKKPATKPWSSSENPWAKNKFSLVSKHKGFGARFTSEGKMNIRAQQGWVPANGKDYGEKPGEIKKVGMTLMEIPDEMITLRKEYYDNLTKQRSVSARDVQVSQALKDKIRLEGE